MLKLVLRGFVQRKLRVLLTAIAIALGVALMAGTYILTDTINHAFAEVFSTAYANKAVVITEKETLGGSEVSVLNQATLARVRAVPGVAAASGAISSRAALLSDQWQAAHRRRGAGDRRCSAAAALRGFHGDAGPSAAHRRGGRDRPGERRAQPPGARPADRDRGAPARAALHDRRASRSSPAANPSVAPPSRS